MNDKIFYVYVYLDPRKPGRYKYGRLRTTFFYEPFYVGKGFGERKFVGLQHAKSGWSAGRNHRINKVRKLLKQGLEPIIDEVRSGMTEEEALAYEIMMIRVIGRLDHGKGPLINLTDGGQGITGLNPKLLVARNLKIGAGNKGIRLGMKQSDECRQNHSRSGIARYQKRRSSFPNVPKLQDTVVLEISSQVAFRSVPKKHEYVYSEERRAKMRAGALRRMAEGRGTPPHRSGSRNGMYGTHRSGTKSPTAKYYYILISPEGKQHFVDRGCVGQVCKGLNVSDGSMANSAVEYIKTGKLYIAEKGRNKGWSAVRFEHLSDNPLRCNNGQLAAKLQQKIAEEGSTTIESVQA